MSEWIEGRFEGVYSGDRVSSARDGEPRRFSFELISGVLEDVALVDAPDPLLASDDEEDDEEIRQARVPHITLPEEPPLRPPGETTLFDVRIRDWRLHLPAEAGGRSFGTVVGTIRARLTPPAPPAEPLPEAPRPDLDAPPRRRARTDAPPLDPASAAEPVDALDAATVYARTRWLSALVFFALIAAGLFAFCGGESAAIWSAPVAAAMLLRLAGRRFAVGTPALQWCAAVALVASQLIVLYGALEVASRLGCRAPIRADLVWLAVPFVAAALVRSRAVLTLTFVPWTLVMCAWCTQLDGTCGAPALAPPSPEPVPNAHEAPPRTDEGGRWPVMPGFRLPFGGLPDAPFGSSVPSARDLLGELRGLAPGAAPAPTASAEPPGGPAPIPSPAPGPRNLPSAPPPPAAMDESARMPLPEPAPAAPAYGDGGRTSRRSGASGTPGGWVSPDHRSAQRESVLISVEHANRVPDAFFESGGLRRVYLPTDPIFASGGTAIGTEGSLQLTRLAALLATQPGRRVAIEVHTDAAGSVESQLALSRQRAASVHGWLLDRGHVDPAQIEVVGVGGRRPLVPPDGSYAAQQPNRRIEVVLID